MATLYDPSYNCCPPYLPQHTLAVMRTTHILQRMGSESADPMFAIARRPLRQEAPGAEARQGSQTSHGLTTGRDG